MEFRSQDLVHAGINVSVWEPAWDWTEVKQEGQTGQTNLLEGHGMESVLRPELMTSTSRPLQSRG